MSILQDYEYARNTIGHKKYDAIDEYLRKICKEDDLNNYFEKVSKLTGSSFKSEIVKQLKKQYNVTLLDDVLYNYEEWIKYNNWYNENYLHKKVEILSIWHTDFDDVRCQAVLYKDGKKVGNIIASYENKNIEQLINDDTSNIESNKFAKEIFKSLIYDDFNIYLNLPKISNYSKLLQEIYDGVCSSDASMCSVNYDELKYYNGFTDKDFENLKREVKKLKLEDVLEIDENKQIITGYGNLETIFNDDRKLSSKEYEMNAYEAVL